MTILQKLQGYQVQNHDTTIVIFVSEKYLTMISKVNSLACFVL